MPVYTYTTLDDPLGINNTLALGIDASGLIVGQYTDNNGEHGFVDSSGIYTPLNDPSATSGTGASGINATGQIVGSFADNNGTHGFLESGGNYTTLDDPNSMSAVFTVAQGINATGQTVGFYEDIFGAFHGFEYSSGTWSVVDDPQGANTYAEGITDNGRIVGYYLDNDHIHYHGFFYLHGVYTTLDDPNARRRGRELGYCPSQCRDTTAAVANDAAARVTAARTFRAMSPMLSQTTAPNTPMDVSEVPGAAVSRCSNSVLKARLTRSPRRHRREASAVLVGPAPWRC